MIMKNLVMIFFALVLLLATMEADGQSFNRLDPKLLSDQQATTSSTLGRKADVGAREAKDPTATAATAASLVAASLNEEDDDNPNFGHYGRDTGSKGANHRTFIAGNNPYAPSKPKTKSP
ncbi:hypothetical protein CRYUN_Cryun40dG0005700 [Craigia yunnanensis]